MKVNRVTMIGNFSAFKKKGDRMPNAYFADKNNKEGRRFIEDYKRKHGISPSTNLDSKQLKVLEQKHKELMQDRKEKRNNR